MSPIHAETLANNKDAKDNDNLANARKQQRHASMLLGLRIKIESGYMSVSELWRYLTSYKICPLHWDRMRIYSLPQSIRHPRKVEGVLCVL